MLSNGQMPHHVRCGWGTSTSPYSATPHHVLCGWGTSISPCSAMPHHVLCGWGTSVSPYAAMPHHVLCGWGASETMCNFLITVLSKASLCTVWMRCFCLILLSKASQSAVWTRHFWDNAELSSPCLAKLHDQLSGRDTWDCVGETLLRPRWTYWPPNLAKPHNQLCVSAPFSGQLVSLVRIPFKEKPGSTALQWQDADDVLPSRWGKTQGQPQLAGWSPCLGTLPTWLRWVEIRHSWCSPPHPGKNYQCKASEPKPVDKNGSAWMVEMPVLQHDSTGKVPHTCFGTGMFFKNTPKYPPPPPPPPKNKKRKKLY